jgi:hypothetical protein
MLYSSGNMFPSQWIGMTWAREAAARAHDMHHGAIMQLTVFWDKYLNVDHGSRCQVPWYAWL